MQKILEKNGEIDLLVNDKKFVPSDELENWQLDALLQTSLKEKWTVSNFCLDKIDKIVEDWIKELSQADLKMIKKSRSLRNIELPKEWIKVWRFILKEPILRDSFRATNNGRAVGSKFHLWNLWAEDCIKRFLSPMDKELLEMVDKGLLYREIGTIMLEKYGENFWKPRKEKEKDGGRKTTPEQIVNNFLYNRLPVKIVRKELLEIILKRLV